MSTMSTTVTAARPHHWLLAASAATGGLLWLRYGSDRLHHSVCCRLQCWLNAVVARWQRRRRSAAGGDQQPHLAEVLFSSRRSSCCLNGSVSPDCRNNYCRSRIERRMLQLMNAAQHTLSVSMYFFTSQRLGDAVVAAHQRGVRVRVIGDKSMAYSNSSQLLRMAQKAIPVRFPVDYDGLVHHKFCLIDAIPPTPSPALQGASTPTGHRRPSKASRVLGSDQLGWLPAGGVLLSGSMNWTMQAITGNWENIVVTSLPQLVQPFAQEFEQMWREFEGPIGLTEQLERSAQKEAAILAEVAPYLE